MTKVRTQYEKVNDDPIDLVLLREKTYIEHVLKKVLEELKNSMRNFTCNPTIKEINRVFSQKYDDYGILADLTRESIADVLKKKLTDKIDALLAKDSYLEDSSLFEKDRAKAFEEYGLDKYNKKMASKRKYYDRWIIIKKMRELKNPPTG